MSTGNTKAILPFIWPIIVMVGLYAVSSIPGETPVDPTIIHSVISWFPPTIHNILHIPAYALLAWTLYRCLLPYLSSQTALPLVLFITSAYGALLEWHQIDIPGRYASLTDVVLNFIGAGIGAWLAWRGKNINKTSRCF